MGEEQYRRGDWDDASASFSRTLAVQPAHFWARFFQAVCHLKARRWEAAKEGLSACLGQRPDFIWGYLFRSFANDRLQVPDEAAADFRTALELNPKDDAKYVLFLTRGIFHFNQKEWDRAAEEFRAAQDLKPDQYNAYLNIAQVYLAQKHFAKADTEITKALQLRPPAEVVAACHAERSRNLLRAGKHEGAIQSCDAALTVSPQQSLPHEIRGRALLALGRFEEAESAFDKYLAKGGKATHNTFRGRGLARMRLGKYPDAVDDYTRALERAPDADIYQHRGWAHYFSDAWKLALRDFARAIDLDPAAGDSYTGRGLARVMLGEYQQAVADADEALQRKPGAPQMMHNIACIFAQAGSRADADRQDLAAKYRARAVQAIRQTLEMLPAQERHAFWREKILTDPALISLHSHPEFKRLP